MRVPHCTWLLLLLLAASPAVAQQAPQPPPATTGYTMFFRGNPVGREDVGVTTGPEGTTVRAQGRLSAPFNMLLRSAETVYGPDWAPQSFAFDASVNQTEITLQTRFMDGTATTAGTQGGSPVQVTSNVSP